MAVHYSYSLFLHLRCFLGGSASQLFSLTLSSLEMFPSLSYILRASARPLAPGKENLDKDKWRICKRGPIIFYGFILLSFSTPQLPSGKITRPGSFFFFSCFSCVCTNLYHQYSPHFTQVATVHSSYNNLYIAMNSQFSITQPLWFTGIQ